MIDENSTKEEVLEAVKKDGMDLRFASAEFKDDREVVLAAVRQSKCGFPFSYASYRLRGDHEVVTAVLEKDWEMLKWASGKGRNRDFIVKYVRGLSDAALYDILIRRVGTGSHWQ
jgi:hypothetical protein